MANSEDGDVSRLYRVNRTIHEMVKDRASGQSAHQLGRSANSTTVSLQGYEVADEEINVNVNRFRELFVPSGNMTEYEACSFRVVGCTPYRA